MSHETRRRLVKREISVGQRQKDALSVARADREGVVDGVIVDFRHPDIPPGEWEAREFWHVGADTLQHCGFIFPTELQTCLDPSNTDRRNLIPEKLKLPRAYAGDKLTVEAVIDQISDNNFDHRHDATIKVAQVVLTRVNGETVRPASPMNFFGVTQLRDGPMRDAYDRIAARILSEHGWPDSDRLEALSKLRPITTTWVSEQDLNLSERALLAVEESERAWHELIDKYFCDDVHGQVLLRTAMAGAVRAAFFQAKHESREAERRATAQLENLAEGPRTRKGWDRIASARKLASKNPEWKRNRIATGVIEDLGLGENTRRALLNMLSREKIGPEPT